MSIALPLPQTEPEAFDIPLDRVKRFTVEEYHAMISAGVFDKDEAYELLEGWIVHKMTKNPDHWIATTLLREALIALRVAGFFVHSQDPVTTRDSEPEPDIALVRGKPRDYRSGNPDPRKAPLVIEVADSSLSDDRRWKKRIYARARIPVYWIVNLIDRQVEIYTEPTGSGKQATYRQCQIVPADGTLRVVIDGEEVAKIAVKEILP